MSGFPYTDEQVRQFTEAAFPHPTNVGDEGWSRRHLERLHEADITVTFPEPRFYAEPEDGRATPWEVVDRTLGTVAQFWGSGGTAERFAREHAERLNREVSS